jgi:hypothetical protein
MVKIAVDVVLLPSDDMMDIAIEANQRLRLQSTDKIVLNKVNCLPHISLAMGVINEDRIAEIGEVLRAIVRRISLKALVATCIHTQVLLSGRTVSAFQIENTGQLQSLHEDIMRRLEPFFSYIVTEDMLHSPPAADETTLQWIKNFPENSGFKGFFPHITIGFGRLSGVSFPIKFTISKVALCHLGNHCTCRKILSLIEP